MAPNTTDLHLRLPPRSKRNLHFAIERMEMKRRRAAMQTIMPRRSIFEIVKGWISRRMAN